MAKLNIDQLYWSPSGQCSTQDALLKKISMQIKEGQFVGLIGPNGCGKTSLLRCVFRHNRPQAGTIHLNGHDIWQQSPRWCAQQIGVVLQEFPSDFGLTVYDVIAMGRTPHKTWLEADKLSDQQLIEQTMTRLSLVSLAQQPFLTLSGGEKQRVLLARAMVQQPEVLILDEPTNHLDPGYQIELLKFLRQTRLTLLASFHDLNLAAAFCDYLYVMDKGVIIESGTPEHVLTSHLIESIFKTPVLIDSHPLGFYPRLTWVI